MVKTEHDLGFYKSQLSFEYFIAFGGTMDECELLHNNLAWSYPTQLNFVNSFTNTQFALSKETSR